jgi:hypothetical protein
VRVVDRDAPLDAEQILRVLAERAVDYVIVGGLAVQTYGHVRTTVDIDIYPSRDPANLQRLTDALGELDAQILNPGGEHLLVDAATLPRATLRQFATAHGAIDVLFDAPGAPPYGELRARAMVVTLGDLELAVAGLDDLIGMKRASARQVDIEDIAALTELDAGVQVAKAASPLRSERRAPPPNRSSSSSSSTAEPVRPAAGSSRASGGERGAVRRRARSWICKVHRA